MRLTLFYMTRAVKNQIRKLFRTWVAVFLLVCIGIGFIFGIGAAALSTLFEEEPDAESGYEETLPEEEMEPLDPQTVQDIVELVTGGIVLAVLFFAAFSADKSGSSIFLMADVNLLFQAPMRPQAVLLFRLIMQAGTSLFATLYLLFQIPNMVLNVGMSIGVAFAVLGAWFLLLVYQKLISVLLYTVCSTHDMLKKRLRPALYVLIGVLALSFILYAQPYNGDYFAAATGFFNAPLSRYIPIWGWLKALVMCAFFGNVWGLFLSLLALVLLAVLLVLVIRRQKADFYEEAMARSEETAALREAQQSASNLKQRKKDRSESLQREGFSRGHGATVYFHKAMYNRFRFAYFHVLTKTSITYLVVALGLSALMIWGLKASFFPAVALTLAGFSFFRALGNPISGDLAQEHFFMVPDSAHRKVFFSFAGGILNSALDLLPAFLISALLLRANPAEALLWFLLILSVGAFSDSVGMFIDLSLSTGLSQIIKSLVQVMFVYFGAAPTAVLIILGFAFDRLLLFAGIAILLNLAITALSLTLSPLFIVRGRK